MIPGQVGDHSSDLTLNSSIRSEMSKKPEEVQFPTSELLGISKNDLVNNTTTDSLLTVTDQMTWMTENLTANLKKTEMF